MADLGTRTFRTRAGMIGCLLAERVLRCDILSGLQPTPVGDCDFDWVGLVLGVTGAAAANCGSDTVYDRAAPVLAKGSTWRRRRIECTATARTLACTNREGHEFTLAPGSWTAS